MDPGLPPLSKEAPRELRGYTTPLWKRGAFKMIYKACVGYAVAALGGEMTWRAAGIAAGISFLVGSWDLFFGEDQITEVHNGN